jgi:hypothetical protein
MTLNTTNMKHYGEKLFQDLMASGRMSDDTCAETCERLLNRLRRYREKHPEEKHVSPKFLNNSRRWAVSDLARRRRRRRVTAVLETELAKNELDCPRPESVRGRTVMFMKLEAVFKSWVARDPRRALFVRVFLLRHAWLLTARRVRLFAPLVDIRKSEFIRQVKRVRRYMERRVTRVWREKASSARYWHVQSIRADIERAEAAPAAREALRLRKGKALARHREAVAALDRIKLTPPLTVVARTTGLSTDQISYALTRCRAGIKSSLQE